MSTGFDLLLAPDLTFDVERFDWAAPDRLELTGRWTGVRGLRFVRPVLTVMVEGRRRRLVALLEHKPWPAVDGEPWTAAFAWAGPHDDVGAARLEVGPTLGVDLPPPGPDLPEPHAPRRPSAAEAALRRAEEAEARAAREKAAAQALVQRERAEQERARLALEDDLAATKALVEDLRLRLAAQEARLGDALAASRAEADGLRVQLATVRADGLAREHHLREQAEAAETERDAARIAADRARAQRDALAEELGSARRRAAAVGEREQLQAELGQERDRARRLQRRLEAAGAPPQKAEPHEAGPPPEHAPGVGAVAASAAEVPADAAEPAAPRTRRQIDLTGRGRPQPSAGTPPPLLVAAEPLRRRGAVALAVRVLALLLVLAALAALAIAVL